MKAFLLNSKKISKTEQKTIIGGGLPNGCWYECKKTSQITTFSKCYASGCGGCYVQCIHL